MNKNDGLAIISLDLQTPYNNNQYDAVYLCNNLWKSYLCAAYIVTLVSQCFI